LNGSCAASPSVSVDLLRRSRCGPPALTRQAGARSLRSLRVCRPTSSASDRTAAPRAARVRSLRGKRKQKGHDRAIRVTSCGRICIGRRKINLSTAFAGQTVGVREVEDQIWLVSFMDYDPGYFDNEKGRVEPGPLRGAKRRQTHKVRGCETAVQSVHTGQSVNHVSGTRCKPCLQLGPLLFLARPERFDLLTTWFEAR